MRKRHFHPGSDRPPSLSFRRRLRELFRLQLRRGRQRPRPARLRLPRGHGFFPGINKSKFNATSASGAPAAKAAIATTCATNYNNSDGAGCGYGDHVGDQVRVIHGLTLPICFASLPYLCLPKQFLAEEGARKIKANENRCQTTL